jgi:hypothetical protein
MAEQRRPEGVAGRRPHEGGEPLELGPLGRQGLGLAILDHLQPMLDRAQVPVGRDHLLGGLRRDVAGCRERADRAAGVAKAEFGLPAAPDQLLGLREELDLADAAAPELDVVAADGDLAMAFHRVDLPLDRVDVLDRGEVEMLAPDEWPEVLQELLADLDIAGDRARLDHRRALPVLAHAFVVGLGRDHRHGERRRAGIRS